MATEDGEEENAQLAAAFPRRRSAHGTVVAGVAAETQGPRVATPHPNDAAAFILESP